MWKEAKVQEEEEEEVAATEVEHQEQAVFTRESLTYEEGEVACRVIPGERNCEIETAVWIWPVSYYVLWNTAGWVADENLRNRAL